VIAGLIVSAGLIRYPQVDEQRAKTRGRAIAVAICCAIAGPLAVSGPVVAAPAATTPAPTIAKDELLGLLRAVPGVRARYREEQHLALLAAPLVAEGTMYFAPPGRLAKHQTKPATARMVVDAGRLAFADAYGRDELELAKNPVVALFVDSVLQVLGGDGDAIDRAWIVAFAGGTGGDPRAWSLELRPREAPASNIVHRLSIRGKDAAVTRIEVVEKGGDRTVTTLSEIDTAHRWEAAELASVFSIGS